jgi:flagellar protein FlaG
VIIQFANKINRSEPAVRRVADDVPNVTDTKPSSIGVNGSQQASPEQLKAVTDDINRAMQQSNQNLEFEFIMDTDTKKTVVRVLDKKTGELVRQIPSEETVAIARSIDQFQRSLLLNQKA